MGYKKGVTGALCLVFIAISGCSTTPTALEVQDNQAKQFTTDSQKSNLYIYRNSAHASSVEMTLEVDGRHVATNRGQTYIKVVVEPGKHKVVSRADNINRLALATLKNTNYFIFQDVNESNGYTSTQLTLVSESQGKAGVKACEMISSIPITPRLSRLDQ
jgi:hypothetical protein